MEENLSSPAEINRPLYEVGCVMNSSISYSNKKRKFQAEILGMPIPKHVRGVQILECSSSSDFNTEPKKFQSNIFARGGETELQSSKDSNSFHGDIDSIMFTSNEATKSHIRYLKTIASDEPSTSSVSWSGTKSCIGLHCTEDRSLTQSISSNAESVSISGSNYEEDLLEFGSHADYNCSEYTNDDIDAEKELYNLLCSNGVAPSNYVLSSGRWSVDQDTHEQGTKKLTIDKEFEQYFSMLML